MALSRKEIIGLVSAFGAVLLTGIIHIGIREWYQADVRYEEGAYYISGKTAVASLKVTNMGHSDAEDVIVTARFDNSLSNVSIDSPSLSLETLAGGAGQRSVMGRLKRLVPSQQVSLFFAVEHQGVRDELRPNFVEEITFKGGIGKTGEPIWVLKNLVAAIAVILYIPILLLALNLTRRRLAPHYERISEMIELSVAAVRQGKDQQSFESDLESRIGKESFRRRTLREVALRSYDYLTEGHDEQRSETKGDA